MMTIGKSTNMTKTPLGIKEKEEMEVYKLFLFCLLNGKRSN